MRNRDLIKKEIPGDTIGSEIAESRITEANFKESSAAFDGKILKVSTGLVERSWMPVADGLATVSFGKTSSEMNFISTDASPVCDWAIFKVSGEGRPCFPDGISYTVVEKSLFTSEHLLVSAAFRYPESKLKLVYRIYVYPMAPGFRTQIELSASDGVLSEYERSQMPSWFSASYAEHLKVNVPEFTRKAFGYYSDSQHRFNENDVILKEELKTAAFEKREVYDWANGLALEKCDGTGLLFIKESHKCVNQGGIDTGAFILQKDSVRVSGLGVSSHYGDKSFWIRYEKVISAWANWSIIYDGSDDGLEAALKKFDRARFPFRPERDMLIMANTWGSRKLAAIQESSLLLELENCAELGIDILQIDDGWQQKLADGTSCWEPDKSKLPSGWRALRAKAEELGIALGLWFPWNIPIENMLANMEEGAFRRFKLDFSNINTRASLDMILEKASKLLCAGGPKFGINWDLTEEFPRFGFYFAREYGNLFLQNCELEPVVRHILYTPWLILRQAWHLAKYMNLNQIQFTIQDPDRSDFAGIYGHDYCFAITMMGIPLFFQETHLLSVEAMKKLKPLMGIYRKHREAILSGYVFSIGDEPDNASLTGFICQCGTPAEGGYITVFREALAERSKIMLKLPLIKGRRLLLENLMDNSSREYCECGDLELEIRNKAGFLFMKYSYI